jgi:uncharacterized protein YceK
MTPTRFAILLWFDEICIMARLVLLLIVFALLAGCAEEPVFKHDENNPVAGEVDTTPRTDPRSGWAW